MTRTPAFFNCLMIRRVHFAVALGFLGHRRPERAVVHAEAEGDDVRPQPQHVVCQPEGKRRGCFPLPAELACAETGPRLASQQVFLEKNRVESLLRYGIARDGHEIASLEQAFGARRGRREADEIASATAVPATRACNPSFLDADDDAIEVNMTETSLQWFNLEHVPDRFHQCGGRFTVIAVAIDQHLR